MPSPRRPTRSANYSRLGLIVPIRNSAELVDAFATIEFIKSCNVALGRRDLLRPSHIVSLTDIERTVVCAVFRTESASFPIDMAVGSIFKLRCSCVGLTVIDQSPASQIRRFDAGATDLDSHNMMAAHVLAHYIGHSMDSAEAELSFQYAIALRYKVFCRDRLDELAEAARVAAACAALLEQVQSDMEHEVDQKDEENDADGLVIDDVPEQIMPALPAPNEFFSEGLRCLNSKLVQTRDPQCTSSTATLPSPRISPFVKPQSTRLDDLIHAFATHVSDGTGDSLPIPLPGGESLPLALLQPLVFCAKAV